MYPECYNNVACQAGVSIRTICFKFAPIYTCCITVTEKCETSSLYKINEPEK